MFMAFKCHLKEDIYLIKKSKRLNLIYLCIGSTKVLKSLEKYIIDIANLIVDYKSKNNPIKLYIGWIMSRG